MQLGSDRIIFTDIKGKKLVSSLEYAAYLMSAISFSKFNHSNATVFVLA